MSWVNIMYLWSTATNNKNNLGYMCCVHGMHAEQVLRLLRTLSWQTRGSSWGLISDSMICLRTSSSCVTLAFHHNLHNVSKLMMRWSRFIWCLQELETKEVIIKERRIESCSSMEIYKWNVLDLKLKRNPYNIREFMSLKNWNSDE